ncbi:hypothetical protein [Methylobacterium mesophilicum]|uniref:hypothetical protein n=1 Tax=Methylobacterium mesophilicum TaxID=39956 RepID=UPI001EE28A59|nr:hypothetical protein [Methylobacterium mesophilicum]
MTPDPPRHQAAVQPGPTFLFHVQEPAEESLDRFQRSVPLAIADEVKVPVHSFDPAVTQAHKVPSARLVSGEPQVFQRGPEPLEWGLTHAASRSKAAPTAPVEIGKPGKAINYGFAFIEFFIRFVL